MKININSEIIFHTIVDELNGLTSMFLGALSISVMNRHRRKYVNLNRYNIVSITIYIFNYHLSIFFKLILLDN